VLAGPSVSLLILKLDAADDGAHQRARTLAESSLKKRSVQAADHRL
jgi:hypothetical protein